MNRMGKTPGLGRRLLVLSFLAIGIVVFSSMANATVLPFGECPPAVPGDTLTPCNATGAPFGTLLASLIAPFTTGNGFSSGTLTSAVYREAGGTLDFYYQVTNNMTSTNCGTAGHPPCDALSRETDSVFSTFLTQLAFRTNGHLSGSLFVDGTVPPASADRNSPGGDVIGFSFSPISSAIAPGTTSNVLIISTNATNFRAGSATVSDGSVATIASFEPTGTPIPTPTPSILANISTRLRVETGDNVLIGGFIVTGTQPKKVIVRAIGPSLPFVGALADPILELRNSFGALIASNDDWRSNQEAEIIATGIPPTNDLESAIVATLPAHNSAYTAIVRGFNDGTGIGLVEAYDLDRSVNSKLANISTRGLVQTGDNVLIAGTIVLGPTSQNVIVRAIGPSLGIPGELADPTLELRDQNGALLRSNDDWRSDQQAEIIATGIPPTNDLESAIVATLPANGASYTAIVRGFNGATGIAVVEVYALN
jgi:hypothetical protein